MTTVARAYLEEKLIEKITRAKEAVEKLREGATFKEVKEKIKNMEPLWVVKKEVYQVTTFDGDMFVIYVERGKIKGGRYYTIGFNGERDYIEIYGHEAQVIYEFFFGDERNKDGN